MIKFKVSKRVISSVEINGENIILPWGVETADSWSFFSLEENVGYRHKVLKFDQLITEDTIKTYAHIKMREGEWILELEETFFEDKILRKAKLKTLEDSNFMDFVIRFRFKNEDLIAKISNQEIVHNRKNRYYQFPVDNLNLQNELIKIDLKLLKFNGAGKFNPHMYVRDQIGEWVVHARLLPISADFEIIKLCSRYFYTSPLPLWFSNLILKSKKIKDYLWYRGEHTPYTNKIAKIFSPIAFPIVNVKKNNEISLEVEVKFARN